MRKIHFIDGEGKPFPEWQNAKLGDILTLHSGKDQKGFEDPDGKYPILATGGQIGTTNTPLSWEESVLIGRKGTIDKPRYIDTPFRTVDTLFYTKMKEGTNAKFIYTFAQTVKWGNLSEASGVPSLNSSIILGIPCSRPSLPEQKKIAEFFSALDERIDLTAEKVRLLKEQKKGYLQRVFNRELVFTDDNGERFPEWETKKLGEVLNLHSGKDQKGYEDPNGLYPILATGGEIGRTNTPLCKEESVLIGRKGTIDKPRYITTPFRTVDTLFYTTMKDKVEAKFIHTFAQTVKWKSLSEASGVPSLNSSIILNIVCPLPSQCEQKKIAEFFSVLDDQIELNANKLALLKEQKKGYLQGIFG